MTAAPVRLQLSRRKGFNLQIHSHAINGLQAVNCARPGKWANKFKIGKVFIYGFLPGNDEKIIVKNAPHAFALHRQWLSYFLDNDFPGCAETRAALRELRGKNLACWCRLDNPWCHLDTLLKLSNE